MTTPWRSYQVVGGVDGGAALDGHVKHLHVVEDHHDVGHRVAICVLVRLKVKFKIMTSLIQTMMTQTTFL